MKSLSHSEKKLITSFDGTEIYYNKKNGKREDLCLIFLHGLGSDAACWNGVRTLLHKKGYSTIAVDLRGHGLSERGITQEFYEIKNCARDILAVMKQENYKRFVIVGHCLGGMVGIVTEGLRPGSSKGLVLISTTNKVPYIGSARSRDSKIRRLLGFIAHYIPNVHVQGHNDASRFIGTDNIDLQRILTDALHTSLQSYIYIWNMVANSDISKYVNKIKIPTLFISGEDDIIVPKKYSQHLAKKVKNAQFEVIEQANHILVINNSAQLAHSVDRFLRSHYQI